MILVDTSVWIEHIRGREQRLAGLLDDRRVFTHPFVLGELLLGGLAPRAWVELGLMPSAPVATENEVVRLIEGHGLAGRGIGYLDAHLVASALLGQASIWTFDSRLRAVATELHVAYEPPG